MRSLSTNIVKAIAERFEGSTQARSAKSSAVDRDGGAERKREGVKENRRPNTSA